MTDNVNQSSPREDLSIRFVVSDGSDNKKKHRLESNKSRADDLSESPSASREPSQGEPASETGGQEAFELTELRTDESRASRGDGPSSTFPEDTRYLARASSKEREPYDEEAATSCSRAEANPRSNVRPAVRPEQSDDADNWKDRGGLATCIGVPIVVVTLVGTFVGLRLRGNLMIDLDSVGMVLETSLCIVMAGKLMAALCLI